jgi:predicted acyltransferase
MPNCENLAQSEGRLASIDALRGFDMFWIIGGSAILGAFHEIFNNSITAFLSAQLEHAEWVGFNFIDIIMPLFLFIVGAAMPFSIAKRLAKGDSKKQIYSHAAKRTIILFVLGMIAQGHLLAYDLSKLHIYSNTLQTIAVGYMISTVLILEFRVLTQVIAVVFFLLLFWALMVLVPVPGCGAGVLTPEGNLAIYLDKLILGRFQDQTIYAWILETPVFAATVMLGVFAGQWLRSNIAGCIKFAGLVVAGVVTLALAQLWSYWFPIIKHLWTSSFVLFSGGLCYLLLAFFYLVIDVWGIRKWAFGFIVIGTNAIAVYMATELFDFRKIGNIFVGALADRLGNWNGLVQNTVAFAIVWLILLYMYRKRTFIKI